MKKTKSLSILVEEAQKFIYIKMEKTSIQSFQLGGVRNLLKMDSQSEWKRMENWL